MLKFKHNIQNELSGVQLRRVIILFLSIFVFFQTANASVESDENWYQTMSRHISETWHDGNVEMYLPLKTIHMPFAYSHEQRENFNENPLGFGIGKGRFNSNGNYEGMMVMVFQDSHSKPEYLAGYQWIPQWSLSDNFKAGLGAVGFISARSDFLHYTPFPGVLPVASLSYKNLMLETTYIPGVSSFGGNVLFVMLKWKFD